MKVFAAFSVAFSVALSVMALLIFVTCLFCVAAQASELSPQAFPHQTGEFMQFAGVFTNTQVNVSGEITIELTINPDNSLEGNVNFLQYSGNQFTCGSGDFVGTKSGDTIELSFTSDDASPACGFYQGVQFTIEAALLNNTIIRGDYSTDTGQVGIVELRRIFQGGIFLPLITR
jgi:hypothetical protein